MTSMSPVERVLRTMEGKPVDRVPVFSAQLEARQANEVLGKAPSATTGKFHAPWINSIEREGHPHSEPDPLRQSLAETLHHRNQAQVEMGFDGMWVYYDDTWKVPDANTLALTSGALCSVIDDGFGNMTYMYREAGIKSPEEYDAWPYWPDPDDVAHRAYEYYKMFMKENGEKACIFGYGFFGGLFESMNWTFGIEKVPLWIKKNPAYVKRFLDLLEEISIKTHTAILEAGAPGVFQTDDFAYKTGPFMRPAMIDEIFGERYRRIIKNVHDRGGKYIMHSCGDNTLLFDYFIDWGADGAHAYENTSNVDIFKEKEIHGDQLTIVGGIGIDYLLSERSKDEEIVEKVKELIKKLGPGGRFLLSPVHSEDSVPAAKLKVMIDAVKEYGAYPIK
jgi:uroporphyrinogen-III decarboxylase